MIITCGFMSFILLFCLLAYHRANSLYWLILPSALLLTLTLVAQPSPAVIAILWSIWVVVAALLNYKPLRQLILTAPMLSVYRQLLPVMSQTEKDALEAGTVWWDGDLFSGNPDWEKLQNIPTSQLTAAEQAFIDGPVNTLCDMINDWEVTQKHLDLPEDVWAYIKEQGFFGMIIPKKYGGLAFSALAHSQVVMKISSRSVTSAVTVMVPNSLGPAKLLLHYGTDEQKAHYLPRLAKGQEIPCFALTGPDAGSDAGAMPDFGVICKGTFEGQETIGINLNWEKRYITLGPVATLLGLAFKLYDPDKILGSQEELGITLALIPTNTPGITIGDRHFPLSIPFQNGPNSGKDVFIPLDWIIGGKAQIGHGWRMLMESLADGRGISLPALSSGASKLASRYTGAYARIRKQFKTPIGQFEGIEEALADMAGKTYQIDAARKLTLTAIDLGENPSVISAIIKYHLTERMRTVVNHAMDIQGGSGICLGPKNLIGRGYQSIPISITVEGANILTRSLIIFGQGAIRCHPYVLQEMEAAHNPDKQQGLIDFDRSLWQHAQFYITNITRSFWFGLTRATLVSAPGYGPARRYYQQLTWMSSTFALVADSAMMVLGGSLKRKERMSARLGDVLSELYIASAVLKQYHDEGKNEADLALMQWSMEDSLLRCQTALLQFINNLPLGILAKLLKWTIFPSGAPFKGPSDKLSQQVARQLLSPSDTRDRLTGGIYIPEDPNEQGQMLEQALTACITAHPFEKKLSQAVKQGTVHDQMGQDVIADAIDKGILTEDEATAVRLAVDLRRKVIMVDSYSPDELIPQGKE
ncbi:MAG: acyl-CoA dehydrogenase [Methylococcales bacterium]|jgi:acyl-CoA dehydrogenase|nr:acyl-CoA dehydrogenase [Methylococcales bacterium]